MWGVFDLFSNEQAKFSWYPASDSNRDKPESKSGALPLGEPGIDYPPPYTLKVVLEIGSMLEGWGLEVYDLGSLATDSLGMGEVIYFPSVPWSEEG